MIQQNDKPDLVRFVCQVTGKRLTAKREFVGKTMRCPVCGNDHLIPPPQQHGNLDKSAIPSTQSVPQDSLDFDRLKSSATYSERQYFREAKKVISVLTIIGAASLAVTLCQLPNMLYATRLASQAGPRVVYAGPSIFGLWLMFGYGCLIALIVFGLAAWARKDPYHAALGGLLCYLLGILFDALSVMFYKIPISGFTILIYLGGKGVFALLFVRAMHYAALHNELREEREEG